MHRRNFLQQTGLLAGASLLSQTNVLAALFRATPPAIRMLRRNVGIFTDRGGTIGFLLSPEGIVTIDSQFPDTAAHYIEEVKKQSDKPFRYLLNTHHHGDHTGGNIAFKNVVEHVVIHQNAFGHQKKTAEAQNALDKTLLADITFGGKYRIKVGDEEIRASWFGPGHTNGDALYHFEEANVVHLGDLMFNRRHPFVDRSAGANMGNWIKVLGKAIRKYDRDTLYIFGHSLQPGAETGTAEDLRKFQDYLEKVLRFAETEIKKGVKKEDFIKNTAIPGVTEWGGDGIQRPLTAAYEEVAAEREAPTRGRR